VKRTPLTVPTVAVPTSSVPSGLRLIPVGSGTPLESIPNIPPRVTADGNVALRSKVAALPTISVGTAGTQTPEEGGGGVDAGVGGVAGVDGAAEAAPIGAELYVPPPQPASAPTANARLRFKR